ncbi:MAG: serine hydrolase domain-containing protein [Acidimicrobiales bacterium]
MSSGGLSEAGLSRLGDVLAGYLGRGEIPGLVALVERKGRLHTEVMGTLADGGGGPVRPDSIFRISSMTKPVTAVATMILVEECALRLDDPVDDLLPELADRRVLVDVEGPLEQTVPAHRPITVRDLLTFRLGFGAVMAAPDSTSLLRALGALRLGIGPPSPQHTAPADEWIAGLGSLPLLHQPGERWMYHTGADVLGVLVERASDRPFGEFLAERVFGPLGMSDTGFHVPLADIDRLATAYWTDPASGRREVYDPAAGGQWSTRPPFLSGGAGLVSTAVDFLTFARMLHGGGTDGTTRILSRPSVELMTTDQLTPANKAVSGLVPGFFDTRGWGFCLSVVTRCDGLSGSVGTFSWDGGMGTSWFVDPSEDLVAVLMTQCLWPSPEPPAVVRDFTTSVYQAIAD